MRKFAPLALLLLSLVGLLWAAEGLERFPRPTESGNTELEPGGSMFSPPPGHYENDIRVAMQPTHPRGEIIFTTDGTTPTLDVGTLYAHPLYLDAARPDVVPLRAVEVIDGESGPVASASYAVGVQRRLPVLSLVTDPDHLWDDARGIFVNTWQRGRTWERPVHLTYIEAGGETGFAVSAGLRVHSSEPFDAPKQSFRLYFRGEYGPTRLRYALFPQHRYQPANDQSYNHFLLQAGDRHGRWTLFRDQLVADVAADLDLRVAQRRPVHLFVNGTSWGLYWLSERVGRFFLEDNYGISDANVVQDGRQREGSDEDWDALADWVSAHDLSTPANFEYVSAQLDVDDFTDFAILYLYFGFSSEDLYAVRPPGGRWRFVYGGSQTFANSADVSLSVLLDAETDFALFLRKLLENERYRLHFAGRMADLLNTELTPLKMQRRVVDEAAALRADISYEMARWPKALPWDGNVAALTEFVDVRGDKLRAHLVDALRLPGTVEIHVRAAPPGGAGRIYVNGEPVPADGWSGDFFVGTPVHVVAVPEPGYAVGGWTDDEQGASKPTASVRLTVTEETTWTARFVTLPDLGSVPRPDDVVINELWINDDGTRYRSLGNRPVDGDWIELLVQRPATVDLRGWRITDNDAKTGMDEGSLILPSIGALAAVPRDTRILIIATESASNAAYFPQDDLEAGDGRLVFYVGNGNLDVITDPGFGISPANDNVVVLAPGPSDAFDDDVGIDFVAEGQDVRPYTFGVLADGVIFDTPFHRLGRDDGAIFTRLTRNDAVGDWIVDPPAFQSGDAFRLDARNIVTPGALNEGQRRALWWARVWVR